MLDAATRGAVTIAHGSAQATELVQWGLDPAQVVDFSTNINPFGPAPAVRQALQRIDWSAYPDPESTHLRQQLAAHHGVAAERILAGNGTAELIWLIALAFLSPGERALIVEPTFGEYARAARIAGATVVALRAEAELNFEIEQAQVDYALAQSEPRVLFLCNPNNPTGTLLPLDTLTRWATHHPATLFVVDEAYIDFAPDAESALTPGRPALNKNVLVLRSLTKTHALAGLRLGYAVGEPQVIAALRRVAPPWSVNSGAQVAGMVALNETAWLDETLKQLGAAKRELIAALSRLGYAPLPSTANYFLLPVGDNINAGADFRRQLLPRGLVVRDCASFGLPGYVRIAARRKEENLRLIEEIERLGDLK